MNEQIKNINTILDKVIGEINKGKDKIFNISESLRDEYEKEKMELDKVKYNIEKVIGEVDKLEALDKKMRLKLVNDAKNFRINDEEVKIIYEEAYNVRLEFMTKQNEEKELRVKRDKLEISLKNYLKNIGSADEVFNQVNVALYYLNGDMENTLENFEGDTKMSLGIKILEAQEAERSRIAREVHDGPAQYLASSIMRMDLCKKIIIDNPLEGIKELEELKVDVKKALKEVRGIIYDLRAPILEKLTLNESIQDLIDSFNEECDIELKTNLLENNREAEHIIEVGVYRIIQELLNNIKKHSFASKASLKLEVGREWIYICIDDNGVGYVLEDVIKNSRKTNSSYGIVGIYDRVNQLGGEIKTNAVINKGTEYKIKIPTNRRN